MRIIAGTAKGIRLAAPKGREVRPTSDKVREAFFSILSGRLENCRFLDLFAGTGANGIEALSRGAVQAVFVESDARVLEAVRNNLLVARVAERAVCHKLRIPAEMGRISGVFDVVFADPPYAFTEYEPLLREIQAQKLLTEDGLVCIEHDYRSTLSVIVDNLELKRQKRYGDTVLSFYS